MAEAETEKAAASRPPKEQLPEMVKHNGRWVRKGKEADFDDEETVSRFRGLCDAQGIDPKTYPRPAKAAAKAAAK